MPKQKRASEVAVRFVPTLCGIYPKMRKTDLLILQAGVTLYKSICYNTNGAFVGKFA
ncbi:MAG: hypothetical protein RSC06_16610 [Clostridia bacterium]